MAGPTAPGGGTSGGAAHVAGVAALLKTIHPDWNYAQLKDRILSTVEPSAALNGRTVTGGRLNAARALATTSMSSSDPLMLVGDSGTGQLTFDVTRFGDDTGEVVLDWSTADGTATAGSDYTASSGQITFLPSGSNTQRITIGLQGDLSLEVDETLFIQLELVSGSALLADPNGQATILNDDTPLLSDSFENGQWNAPWVEDSQDDWFTSTQRSTDGNYSAEVDSSASNATLSLANPIDLTPYGSAELTFDWLIESGLDTGEYLALDLFDGVNWHDVATVQGNIDPEDTWHHEVLMVDSSYLVDNFQLRFRGKMNSPNEDANIDNVHVVSLPTR